MDTLLGKTIMWEADYQITETTRGLHKHHSVYRASTIVHVTPRYIIIEDVETKEKRRLLRGGVDMRVRNKEEREIYKLIIERPQPKTPKADNTPYDGYILLDDNDIVHYVGITRNITRRYQQHCKCVGTNLNLNLWIQGHLQRGKYPKHAIIFSVEGRAEAEKQEALSIASYLKSGMPLKNIMKVGGGN